jgi:hypothetical protein
VIGKNAGSGAAEAEEERKLNLDIEQRERGKRVIYGQVWCFIRKP